MTIKNIAHLANVSTTTVSNVINDKADNISVETKNKILAIIEEQNYVPYRKVVDKLTQKSNTVALIVSDVSDAFCAELLRGVEDFFFSKEFSVIICSAYGSQEKERGYVKMLKKQNVRGIIRFPLPGINDEAIQSLEREDIINVLLDDNKQIPNALKIHFNNQNDSYIAAKHLIEMGHERIGYISNDLELPYLAERFEGYKQALIEAKLTVDTNLIYTEKTADKKQCGYLGAKYLAAQNVSAICCSDDVIAAATYRAIRECNLTIPEDISVVGFNDSIICELIEPKLTSVKQSAYDMGRASAQMLYRKINKLQLDSDEVLLKPTLITRDSVASPNGKRIAAKKKYLVVGEVCADVILDVDAAEPGGNAQTARKMSVQAGGWAVCEAKRLCKEGNEVFLIGCIGNDAYGRQVFEEIAGDHINTAGLFIHKELPTGIGFVTMNSDGKASRVDYPGANAALEHYDIREVNWMIEKADHIILDDNFTAKLKKKFTKK